MTRPVRHWHMSSAPPVNLQVNNPDDLANMLFTDNTNVNMKHLHEGMLSHTDAINQLAVNQARPGGVFARAAHISTLKTYCG